MERNYPIRTYVFAGIGLIVVLFLFRGCNDSEAVTPPPPTPTVTVTPTPAPEVTEDPESEGENSPGKEAGEVTRDTVDELYQWGSDFVEGFQNTDTPTP